FPKPYADFVQRLRVPCGFLLLITFATLSEPSRLSMLIGIPLSVLGLLLRGWASGHLAKDQQLATSGPYSYIRNPLYAGTLVTALGIAIASRNLWLCLIFAAAFGLIYLPAVELEEQHLSEIFPNYAAYAKRVRRFLPVSRISGSNRRFSFALYKRNEEYKALLGFLLALLWLIWRSVIRFR
ncbi:MAG: isoprenylcysteine carboxylmethyltransferase family protein, partial [Acidobacteriaceae bacterium]|nr:isoprenylcysteine carboxylmethyltransferase family protein [Acidobacteriaceae bacterium]